MRVSSKVAAVVTGILLHAALLPGFACAAETVPEMDVQIWPGGQAGQIVVIVGMTLPESTELPTTVRLPLVAGTSVSWAGEIVGTDTSQDIEREVALQQGVGGQYAEFELSESRQAQIELSGLTLTTTGSSASARVEFVQTTPGEKLTGFSARLPVGAQDVTIDPAPVGAAELNDVGEALYTLPSSRLAEGASQAVTISYSTGGAGNTSSAQAQGSSVLLGVLAGLLVLAIVVLIVMIKRSGSRPI